jgi:hypothetical protein
MKKTLCLLVMMLVLLPSVAVSQNKINRSRFQHNRLLRLAAAFESFLDISSPLRKYLSDLYKTDFDNIANAPDVLRSLMPKTVAYAQERMAAQYGIDISVLFSPAKSPGRKGVLPNKPTLPPELARFAGVLGWGMTVVSCYWLVDEVGERYIIYDLEHNSNFTHDEAVAAAEHITAEGAEEAGRFVDSYSIVPLPFWEHLAKLANFIEALIEASDNDPNAYDPNEGDIPDNMRGGPGRVFPNDGGMPGGHFIGTPGPGQGTGNGNVTIGPCYIFGPIGVDALGNVIYGWYPSPC